MRTLRPTISQSTAIGRKPVKRFSRGSLADLDVIGWVATACSIATLVAWSSYETQRLRAETAEAAEILERSKRDDYAAEAAMLRKEVAELKRK